MHIAKYCYLNFQNGRIKLTLLVGNTPIVRDQIIDSDEAVRFAINPNEPVHVTIFTVNQQFQYYTINAPGKTKYLTWNPAKATPLYPQTGPMMGLMGRYNPLGAGTTESGLPLGNNVTEREIVRK